MRGPKLIAPLLLLALLAAAGTASAQTGEDETKPARLLGVDLSRTDAVSREQKKYAKGVASDLVCLCGTCPRESLATCDCGWAAKGRKTIQLALLDGKTDEAVLTAFRQAFGDKVFATPPGSVELMATAIPYVLVVAMLLGLLAFGLRNRQAPAAARLSEAMKRDDDDEDEAARILRRELEEMD